MLPSGVFEIEPPISKNGRDDISKSMMIWSVYWRQSRDLTEICRRSTVRPIVASFRWFRIEFLRTLVKQVMEHLDDVEEARYMVEEYLKNVEKNDAKDRRRCDADDQRQIE